MVSLPHVDPKKVPCLGPTDYSFAPKWFLSSPKPLTMLGLICELFALIDPSFVPKWCSKEINKKYLPGQQYYDWTVPKKTMLQKSQNPIKLSTVNTRLFKLLNYQNVDAPDSTMPHFTLTNWKWTFSWIKTLQNYHCVLSWVQLFLLQFFIYS